MYLKQHIFFGFIFAIALFLLFPKIGFLGFSIIFLSSVLIDIDHYIYYIYEKKDFNLKNAYKCFIQIDSYCRALPWKQRTNLKGQFYIFHGVELLLLLILLSFFFNFFIFIFTGFAFHLLLDLLDQTTYWDKIDKLSTIHDILKNKKINYPKTHPLKKL